MKKINFVSFCFLTLVLLITAHSALAVTTVVGKYDPTVDVQAVQNAVDGGGTVVLQGKFHFGAYGSVGIYNSVEIVGENATIEYGFGIFGVDNPGINVIIRGSSDSDRLTFKYSLFAVLGVWNAESLTIKHVNIYDVMPAPWGDRYGLWAQIRWGLGSPYDPLLLGKLSVTDCIIDLGTYDPGDVDWGTGIGIFGIGTPEEEVEILIKDNIISNCSAIGIDIYNIAGTASVIGNTIKPGEIAINIDDTGANGITIGNDFGVIFNFTDGEDIYQPDWAQFEVKNNYVECGPVISAGIFPMGIYMQNLNGAIVRHNAIKVENGISCIHLGRHINDGHVIKDNICSGTDTWSAFWLRNATNCSILNNNCTAATTDMYQIFMAEGAINNSIQHNQLGALNGSENNVAGIFISGHNNNLFNTTFHGDYTGWPDIGFVLLDAISYDNHVVALKKATPPHGFDLCNQVMDLSTNNKISGYKKCNN